MCVAAFKQADSAFGNPPGRVVLLAYASTGALIVQLVVRPALRSPMTFVGVVVSSWTASR